MHAPLSLSEAQKSLQFFLASRICFLRKRCILSQSKVIKTFFYIMHYGDKNGLSTNIEMQRQIIFKTWIAQGRFTNMILTPSKQWGVCDKLYDQYWIWKEAWWLWTISYDLSLLHKHADMKFSEHNYIDKSITKMPYIFRNAIFRVAACCYQAQHCNICGDLKLLIKVSSALFAYDTRIQRGVKIRCSIH